MNQRLNLLVYACGITLLIVNCVEVALYALGNASVYSDLPRAEFSRYFYDLRIWSMNMSDCKIPVEMLAGRNHCASDFYVFDYPAYPIYLLRALGWTADVHGLMGSALGILAIMSTIFLTLGQPLHKWAEQGRIALVVTGIVTAVVCIRSLPLRYAVERGQIDMVVYIVLTCYFAFIKYGKGAATSLLTAWSTFLALAALSLAKIYPIASLAWLTMLYMISFFRSTQRVAKSKVRRIFAGILPLVLTTGCVVLLAKPFTVARAANSFRVGGHGFGLSVLTDAGYSNGSELNLMTKVTIAAAFFLMTLWIFKDVRYYRLCEEAKSKKVDQSSKSKSRSKQVNVLPIKAEAILLLAVFPFMEALYATSESINYKIIFVIALIPWFYQIIDSSDRTIRHFGFLQLILGLIMILSPGIPFSPSLYLYVEWFNHFFSQPAFFGCLAGQGIWCSWRLTIAQIDSQRLSESLRNI